MKNQLARLMIKKRFIGLLDPKKKTTYFKQQTRDRQTGPKLCYRHRQQYTACPTILSFCSANHPSRYGAARAFLAQLKF